MTVVLKLRHSSRAVAPAAAAPTWSSRDRRRCRPRPTLLVASSSSAAAAAAAASPSSSPRPRYRVAVVGGGVIGLSTALRLAEEARRRKEEGAANERELEISVFARGFESETTSSGAGGLWEPYKLGDTPSELVNRWSAETLEFLVSLVRGGGGGGGGENDDEDGNGNENAATGVLEGPIFQFWTAPAPKDPSWAVAAPGFRRLSEEELRSAFETAERGAEANRIKTAEDEDRRRRLPSFALAAPAVVDGWTFASAAAQPSRYLPWLARRAESLGVKLVRRELNSLEELFTLDGGGDGDDSNAAAAAAAAVPAEGGASSPPRFFDAVVNCAGLAGGDLSGDDASPPTPVRGQVARLRYPSSRLSDKESALLVGSGAAGLFLDEETYLIRNVDFVVAGGTGQLGDACAEPRVSDRESILARVRLLSPELVEVSADGSGGSSVREVEDWAGLRPLRSPVRLEARTVELVEKEGEKEEEQEEEEEKAFSPPSKAETPQTQTRRSVLVVSNYGHGGSGFTLHWGCAGDVVALVLEGLKGGT